MLVVAHFFKGDTLADRGDIRVIGWGGAVPALSSLPVVVFAYTCHQNVSILLRLEAVNGILIIELFDRQMFSVLNEINDNSHYRTTGVIFASIGSAAMVYILIGVTGYLSFGNSVSGNIIGMCMYSTFLSFGVFIPNPETNKA